MIAVAVLQLLLVAGVLEFDVQVVLVVAAFLLVYAWVFAVSSAGHRHGTLPRSVTRFGLLLGVCFPVGLLITAAGLLFPSGSAARSPSSYLAWLAAIGWLGLPVWPLVLARMYLSSPQRTPPRKRNGMRTAYKVLAYLVAAEVAIQAMVMVWAIAGLGVWVDGGGVLDKAVMESSRGGATPFPEVFGFIVHGINGTFVIPGIALLLVIISFFTKVRGAIKWAVIVFVLVVVQGQLGFLGHEFALAGALHGLNALALFVVALYAGRRIRTAAPRGCHLPRSGSRLGLTTARRMEKESAHEGSTRRRGPDLGLRRMFRDSRYSGGLLPVDKRVSADILRPLRRCTAAPGRRGSRPAPSSHCWLPSSW